MRSRKELMKGETLKIKKREYPRFRGRQEAVGLSPQGMGNPKASRNASCSEKGNKVTGIRSGNEHV